MNVRPIRRPAAGSVAHRRSRTSENEGARARIIGATLLVATFAVASACASKTSRNGFEPTQASHDLVPEAGVGFSNPDAQAHPCSVNSAPDGVDLSQDFDGDGYPLKIDCDECDPKINPGALDVAGNNLDDDCSGKPDDEVTECDEGIAIDSFDPIDAARALGICKEANPEGKEWGIVNTRFIRPDGTPAVPNIDVGVLTKFGVNAPQAGKSMLVLSSGYARAPGDPGFGLGTGRRKGNMHGPPPGYPKEFAGCPAGIVTGAAQDGIGLEVVIRVPSNAKALRVQQNFFTYEYSEFICTQWNDFFVTLMDPKPPGLPDDNIAFDALKNPISVNNGLLEVCSPGTFKGKTFTCPLGTASLEGTGFEANGATGWLTTTAPVTPGSLITLRFAIWDSGDGFYDSIVLLDDFAFSTEASETLTVPSVPK